MLHPFGLGPAGEAVYRALLVGKPGSMADLVATCGLSPAETQATLDDLVGLGLAVPGSPLPVPIGPADGLRGLLARRRAELDQAEHAVSALARSLAGDAAGSLPATSVELVTGANRIGQLVAALVDSARDELLIFDAPPYAVSGPSSGGGLDILGAVARGVSVRVIFAQEGLELPGRMESVAELHEFGVRTRVLHHLPTKLVLVDRSRALLPPASATEVTGRALVLREVLVDNVLLPLFEGAWQDAVPFGLPVADDGPGPSDRRLLALLASGMKDEAIARQNGVHVRTTRRRITELLDRLDATTRFQAGAQAALRGWLDGSAR